MNALLPVIKAVLSNKLVILTAIAVFLYLDFVCFVARYHKKKTAAPAKKSVAAPAPAPAPAAESEDAADEGDDDEE